MRLLKMLLAVALIAGAARMAIGQTGTAPTPAPTPKPTSLHATLVKVDGENLLVKVAATKTTPAKEMTVATDRKTAFILDYEEGAKLSDLKPDMTLTILPATGTAVTVRAHVKGLYGVVVKVDGKNLVIKATKTKKEETVATDDKTVVVINGKAGNSLADLKAGMQVKIIPATGTAAKIAVVPAAPAKAPKAGAAPAATAVLPVGQPDADGSFRLTLEKLPAAVKEAFLKQAGGNPIRGISMEMHDGKPVYDCDVFINGKKYAVIADAKGTLLSTPIRNTEAGKPAEPANDAAPAATFQDTFNVDKTNLVDKGRSTYFILEPGYRLVLEDGKDTLTITVLDETKTVDGVKTRIVEERETKGGKLEEVSRNYFAVDKTTGDIYYFGEDVDMYGADGKVTGHEGSWLAGVSGAKFGLGMPGKPKVGARYYQEVAPEVAMDRAEVVSVSEECKVPAGTFKNCLRTRESSAVESGSEDKLYAPDVGLLKDGGFLLARVEKPKS